MTLIYVPERSQSKHLFSYSVRFSLLSVAEQERLISSSQGPLVGQHDHVIHSAQLLSRHWVVRDETGEVADDTRGEQGVRFVHAMPRFLVPCAWVCL